MRELVDEIVLECARGLFDRHGLELERVSETGPFTLVAAVGFAGHRIRGSLGLGVGAGLVSNEDLEDWVSEMANQLLGRIANRFSARGVEVDLAAPMVLRGVELRVETSATNVMTYPFRAVGGKGELCAWIDIRPFQALALMSEPVEPVVAEGDMLVF